LSSFILEALDLDGNEFFDVARPIMETYTLENNTSTVSTLTCILDFKALVMLTLLVLQIHHIAVTFDLNTVNFRLGNSTTSSNRQSSISGEVNI
jgi:hypothetical protein